MEAALDEDLGVVDFVNGKEVVAARDLVNGRLLDLCSRSWSCLAQAKMVA